MEDQVSNSGTACHGNLQHAKHWQPTRQRRRFARLARSVAYGVKSRFWPGGTTLAIPDRRNPAPLIPKSQLNFSIAEYRRYWFDRIPAVIPVAARREMQPSHVWPGLVVEVGMGSREKSCDCGRPDFGDRYGQVSPCASTCQNGFSRYHSVPIA